MTRAGDKAIAHSGHTGGAMPGHRLFAKASREVMTRASVSMQVMEMAVTAAIQAGFSAESSAAATSRRTPLTRNAAPSPAAFLLYRYLQFAKHLGQRGRLVVRIQSAWIR